MSKKLKILLKTSCHLFVKMTIIVGCNRNNGQINHFTTTIEHSERERHKWHFLSHLNPTKAYSVAHHIQTQEGLHYTS